MTDNTPFTHLHLHSVYSLLDGAIKINDLIQHVKKQNMTSVAVTDHGNMFSTVEFYEQAVKNNIKPIIGCEFYVAPGSRFEKKMVEKLADGQAYHLILLAKNKTGYKNLIKMSSKAYTEGFYRKPRIDYELLNEHTQGLVCLTACLAGEVNRKLYRKQKKQAWELAGHLNEMFGDGNFYLEIQDHGIPEQKQVAHGALEIHKQTGIPLVLTNDSHFLKREDQKVQDIMLRIQLNKREDEPLEFGFNEEFYVKSSQEMRLLYPELPEVYLNTHRINEMIDLSMDFGHPLLPDFKTPNGQSLAEYLEQKVNEGIQKRFQGRSIPSKYMNRIAYELEVIKKMRFESYFLIVSDFIEFVRMKQIPMGPGRGSVAGSLIAYALGITNVDPISYDLLFERFLNPYRNEMPDIDIDFCRDRREEVIQYVIEKYGKERVSQIITFGTLSAKAVLKDVARVLGFSFSDINIISKNIPDTPGMLLSQAIEQAPMAKEFFNSGKRERLLWDVAVRLEGVPRNAGKHAAGVVIGPDALDTIIPLARDTKTGSVITQFEKDPLEKVGLVKMDFLGLKNLTILQAAVQEIKKRYGKEIDLNKIPLDDPKVFDLLRTGQTKGIFQVERSGITNLLMNVKPDKFEDIVACIALYRPGPLQSGMADEYAKRKNKPAAITYPHPKLERVLKDTFGTIIYQEQVMIIAQVIAGFSMAEADALRKAMGKKKIDVMEKMKHSFIEGARKNDHDHKWSSDLFNMLLKFGKYAFNKSHSVAYGLITYQTAYLKANYLVEFMKATLDADIDNIDKLIELIYSCRQMGLKILPPDIHESDAYFGIIGKNEIRYGLLGLRGLGKAAVDSILAAREAGKFTNLSDFIRKISYGHFTKKSLEVLILSGSLDSLEPNRAGLLEAMENILRLSSQIKKEREQKQEFLFGEDINNMNLLRIDQSISWQLSEKIKREREVLGFYLTSHPLEKYKNNLEWAKISSISEIDDGISSERKLTFMGVVEAVKTVNTKRGSSFISATVSDLSGRQEIRIYNHLYEKVRNDLREEAVLIFSCKISIHRDKETPFISVSANQIYAPEKLNDLLSKSLHLYLACNSVEELQTKIGHLKKILRHHSGENPVYLHYKDKEEKIQAVKVHPIYYVQYTNDLEKSIKSILKADNHFLWKVGEQVLVSLDK